MVKVTANTWAIYGNHIYITITAPGNRIEYTAKNILDAHSFVERTLGDIDRSQVEWSGDTILNFTYHKGGD